MSMDALFHRAEPILGDEKLELSLIELVIAASDLTEDELELADLVDGLIEAGHVKVVSLFPEDGTVPVAG